MYFTSIKTWDLAKFRQKDEVTEQARGFQENYFQGIHYYISQKNRPTLYLMANELLHNGTTGNTSFTEPDGHFFTENRDQIFYRALNGSLKESDGLLILKDKVNVVMDELSTDGDQMDYFLNQDRILVKGKVLSVGNRPKLKEKVIVNSKEATFWPRKRYSQYRGEVVGKVKRMRAYEENIDFQSNKLNLDEPKNFMELLGDVYIKKQALTARGHRGEVYLENYNKKLKYFVLYDDVKVTEKIMLEGKSFIRRAYGEQLDGYMNEDKIVLTGYPRAYQFDDVIKGNVITLRENNEVVEVDDSNTKFKIR